MLDDNLKELKSNQIILSAFKVAVHTDFEADKASLKQLTAVQVRALRTELVRLEKLWHIIQASEVAGAVVHEIATCSSDQPEAMTNLNMRLEDGLKDLRMSDDVKAALKAAA